MTSQDQRRGFTLVEILVVITILAILIGLLLPALALLKTQRAKAETRKLMKDLASAVSQYLADFPALGDSAADFEQKPLLYLDRRARQMRRMSYIELPGRYIGLGNPPNPVPRDQAEVVIDPFGESLTWKLTNAAGVGGRIYTATVEMRSTLATSSATDDIVLTYQLSRDRWE